MRWGELTIAHKVLMAPELALCRFRYALNVVLVMSWTTK